MEVLEEKYTKTFHTLSKLLCTAFFLGLISTSSVTSAQGQSGENASPSEDENAVTGAETQKLTDIVVTASRVQESVLDVPANTSVITADNIAKTTANTVPEVLAHEAGIDVKSWLGTGRQTSVDIRGFGETAAANTLVLIDGRRINSPDLSGVDWTTVPLERVKRVEVIRGGGSVMHGDNSTGGVVNIITKKGKEKPQVQAEIRGGSYGYFKQSLGLSGSFDENWYYNINSSYTDTNGYRDNGYFRNKSGGLRLGYDPDTWFGFDFVAGLKDDRYGLPGAISESADRTSTTAPDDFAETREHYLHFTPRVTFPNGSELSLGLKLRNAEQYSEWVSVMGRNEYKLYEWGVSPKYTFNLELLKLNHRVVSGIDYYSSDLHEIEKTFGTTIDRHRHEAGYYINDQISLISERLFLDLGYRRTRVNYDFSTGEHEAYSIDSVNTGVTYRYAAGSKMFVSFDRAYRTVLLDELGGPALDQVLAPQISEHYQAGLKHKFNEELTAGATLFQIDTENEILFDPDYPGAFFGTNVNYEETRRRGLEFELEARPLQNVRVFANYTWMSPEMEGNRYNKNEIPGVPRHQGSIGLTAYPTDRLTLDTRARWSDDKMLISDWDNNVGEKWDDDYFVWDMMISYDVAPFTFYAGVNNILNQEYAEFGRYSGGAVSVYPSPERNFVGGVKITKRF